MNRGYLISIITPSRNTSDELFRAAFDSVMAQTLDESFIEWVIVVHNSTQEHLDFVRSLCEGHPGFRVYELNNDRHTASSPRNYALSKAAGKYVTFLDADDRLTPECLETIVYGMDKTGAQVGKFRSEKTEEDDRIVGFLDNRVRFPQTAPLISLHKGDPDIRKIMTMANMMMSCQVIERSHLEKHSIRFREHVRIYEDVVFNIECLRDAETIAVFPQLIGYIYYMHHGSTMQDLKAPAPEEILSTCRDIAFQLRLGVDSGLYMRYLFFGHMKQIADMISRSEKENEFPDEIRRQIRELLGPFFALIDPPEPDRKFLSAEEIREIMDYIRLVILGDEKSDEAGRQAGTEDVLIDILRSEEDTEIGETWGFERIRSQEVYREQVPVNVYDSFSPMIELMNRIGESGILFNDPVRGYAITYGPMNVPRMIPYTDRTIAVYVDMLDRFMNGSEGGSTFLLAGSIKGDRPFADSTYPDSITGAVLQRKRADLNYNSHAHAGEEGVWLTGPEQFFFREETCDPRYLRLIFALLDRNVTQIISPFTGTIFETFRYLEGNHEKLVSDIEKGTLDGASGLSSEDRELFCSLFDADPARARELRDIFACGFDEPVIRRIWPGMKRIVACRSVEFELYTYHLARYAGDIPVTDGGHVDSEAVVGTSCGDGCYRLAYGECYFEFIPEGRDEKDVLAAEELREGCYYEVLVTNRAGLYRYRLGDVIRVERMENGTPVYRFAGKVSSMLRLPVGNGASVCIRPGDMAGFIIKLEEKTGIIIEDYCVKWDGKGSCLKLYVEPSVTDASFERLMSMSKEGFENTADRELAEMVPAYGAALEAGRIRPLSVSILQPLTHLAYRDKRMYQQKIAPDQIKPVHELNASPVAARFFDVFIVKDRD